MTGKSDTPTRDRRILEAVADYDCRAILEATVDVPRTAAELADCCAIPISTVYRKVKPLTRTGLLAERTRIRSSGPNCTEFALRVRTVNVDLVGMCACEFDHVVDTQEVIESVGGSRTGEGNRASTDGGTPSDADPRYLEGGSDEGHSAAPDTGPSEGSPPR